MAKEKKEVVEETTEQIENTTKEQDKEVVEQEIDKSKLEGLYRFSQE